MDASHGKPKDAQQQYEEIAGKTAQAIGKQGSEQSIADKPKDDQKAPTVTRIPWEPPMGCRMFFPTSGHQGFDLLKVSDELPPVETVRAMMLYETRLRLSDSIQDIMDEYHVDEDAVR